MEEEEKRTRSGLEEEKKRTRSGLDMGEEKKRARDGLNMEEEKKRTRSGLDMGEEKTQIAWYRLRGLGLVCLCSFLFFGGAYIANQKSVAVSGAGTGAEMPVCCVQTEKKQAALTFDADRKNAGTGTILKILEAYDVHATFFMTGEWVERYPEEVRKIAAAGHDLGNHSQSHKNMTGLSRAEIQKEIQEIHEQVRTLTGIEMNLFRAPYGDYDDNLIETVKNSGYLPIQWDVDSEDWKNYGVDSILKMVTENERLGNGSIILMHNDGDYTAQALESVITGLVDQGYELVPVSELICWTDYHIDEEGRQIPD